MDEHDPRHADLFDDFQVPPDTEWDDYTVVDEEHANRLVRKARHLKAEIRDVERLRDQEVARIAAIASDRTYGSKRALAWIERTLAGFQREVLHREPRAPRAMRLMAGATVKANPVGQQPVIGDPKAYAVWAVQHEHFDRAAPVKVPYETLLLAEQALRAAVAEDVGDRAPCLVTSLADQLAAAMERDLKLKPPTYAEGNGRVKFHEPTGHWVDRETGDVVPGLVAAGNRGFTYDVQVDE